MTWATDRRLDYIDRCLAIRGEVRRADLVDAFGVSVAQASADLNAFIAAHPDRMAYDKTRKAYVPASKRKGRPIVLDEVGRLVIVVG